MAHCRQLSRSQAANFYHGMKLTPEPKRSALFAIYALMRACDDLADDNTDQPDQQVGMTTRQTIDRFRADVHRVWDQLDTPTDSADLPQGPHWPAVHHTARCYRIDRKHIDDMLDGQIDDLSVTRYDTFDDLYRYCYRVASTVGLVCIAIWGHDRDVQTTKLAEYRGIALQLTNIIRDVVEDAQRGRWYLPMEDFQRFGVDPGKIAERQGGDSFERMVVFQIERARSYYQMSASLETHIAPDCRPTCWALMQIYRALLEQMAQRPNAVLRKRARLSLWRKMAIAMQATWRRTWPGGGQGSQPKASDP